MVSDFATECFWQKRLKIDIDKVEFINTRPKYSLVDSQGVMLKKWEMPSVEISVENNYKKRQRKIRDYEQMLFEFEKDNYSPSKMNQICLGSTR